MTATLCWCSSGFTLPYTTTTNNHKQPQSNPFPTPPHNPHSDTPPVTYRCCLQQTHLVSMKTSVLVLLALVCAAVFGATAASTNTKAVVLPPQCLRAAVTLCKGEATNALTCLRSKVAAKAPGVPAACVSAMQAAAKPTKQSRGATLGRLLTESNNKGGGTCVITSVPSCNPNGCNTNPITGPNCARSFAPTTCSCGAGCGTVCCMCCSTNMPICGQD